jgi:hypothetical protein
VENVAHTSGSGLTYNHSTWEAEVGGLQVWGQPGLQSKILSQKQKKNIAQNITAHTNPNMSIIISVNEQHAPDKSQVLSSWI